MQFGLPVLLFVVFLILKLTGVIAWSWLWVLSPLWIGIAASALIIVFVLIFGGRKIKRFKRDIF